jgi:hypothetical protein
MAMTSAVLQRASVFGNMRVEIWKCIDSSGGNWTTGMKTVEFAAGSGGVAITWSGQTLTTATYGTQYVLVIGK